MSMYFTPSSAACLAALRNVDQRTTRLHQGPGNLSLVIDMII
jgi:hypothetical protein